MHEINDVVVHDGKIVLTHLPYTDGQHVRVLVVESDEQAAPRAMLKGGVERFDNPFEPMVPSDDWEMLK